MKKLSVLLCLSLFVFLAHCASAGAAGFVTDRNHHTNVARALTRGRGVALYFYSDRVKDSLKDFSAFEALEKRYAGKITVFKVKADKNRELLMMYGVQYSPTVVAIRKGEGVVKTQEVELDAAAIAGALTSAKRPPWGDALAGGIKEKKPTLLFFMAEWCGYCREMAPQVRRFSREWGGLVNVKTIDVDNDPAFAAQYLIFGVPVLVAADSSGIIRERMGFPSEYNDFVKVFKKMGVRKP